MEQQFKTHISSKHRLFDLHIRETLQYRDLIFLTVRKNFTVRFKQTLLGPLWAIINPLMTTIVFTVIFGHFAKLVIADGPGDFVIPHFLFYMGGNVCWNHFASTLSGTSRTFLDNRETMGKVYYPRLAAPVSIAFSCLIYSGIQFLLFAGFWVYFVLRGGTGIRLTPFVCLLPLELLHTMILAVGLGIILSAVTTKYRDLTMLVGFGLQLWRYACPIAYGLQLIPEKYMGLYLLNPVTPILTTFRLAVFGCGYFDLKYYALSWGVSIVLFFIGLIMFSRIERTFMDTI